jgi:hypothetical protein
MSHRRAVPSYLITTFSSLFVWRIWFCVSTYLALAIRVGCVEFRVALIIMILSYQSYYQIK